MAAGLNRVMLLGDIASDPQVYVTRSGKVVLSLKLATVDPYLDANDMRRERTSFHPVVLFGTRAEALSKVLRRGSRVFVDGAIRTHEYEDRTGRKWSKTEVVAAEMLTVGEGERAEAAEEH